MGYYIVFGSIKRPADFMGGKRLDWGQPPIGVFEAASAEDACMAAASDQGQMSTYFAVEGTPWGIDLIDTPARQLGRTPNANERMADHLDRIERLDEQRRELEQQKQHNLTRDERVAAAEAKSAAMEQEAGIGDVTDYNQEPRATSGPRPEG